MTKRFLFTEHLYEFLEEAGYTHILLSGVGQMEESDTSADQKDFILIPWKPEAESQQPDTEHVDISSTAARRMINVTEGINYWVELPEMIAGIYEVKIQIDEE